MEVLQKTKLESYFQEFRENIIGNNGLINLPNGEQKRIIYTDWTASGRMYKEIEDKLINEIYPFVANTHTDTNSTGQALTHAYHYAQKIIKKHVNAGENDVIITADSGMTGVINKLQRILGFKVHERFKATIQLEECDIPIVFITHMEHHSNQTSWLETIAEVEIIRPNSDGLPDLNHLKELLAKYSDRKVKIASVTAASNVTGIQVDYHGIAEVMHASEGLCFVDFACAAPYVTINMHPENDARKLDAIFFSPHKFLGGPGTSGVLVFNKSLYTNSIPDHPGGGTVTWTNPWKEHSFVDSVEEREDGGTPGFLQTIRTALCIRLKDKMGVQNMLAREEELKEIVFDYFDQIPKLHLLANDCRENRLGIFSFYIDGLHFNKVVKLLNDKFGVQTRGGCSCAGTYGHYLLNIDIDLSHELIHEISSGNCSNKPGWVRMSIHPTMTNQEMVFVCEAIKDIALNYKNYLVDYDFSAATGKITRKDENGISDRMVEAWFEI